MRFLPAKPTRLSEQLTECDNRLSIEFATTRNVLHSLLLPPSSATSQNYDLRCRRAGEGRMSPIPTPPHQLGVWRSAVS